MPRVGIKEALIGLGLPLLAVGVFKFHQGAEDAAFDKIGAELANANHPQLVRKLGQFSSNGYFQQPTRSDSRIGIVSECLGASLFKYSVASSDLFHAHPACKDGELTPSDTGLFDPNRVHTAGPAMAPDIGDLFLERGECPPACPDYMKG